MNFLQPQCQWILSNQNKLSEFYEELKRLNINELRPNINKCFADFISM